MAAVVGISIVALVTPAMVAASTATATTLTVTPTNGNSTTVFTVKAKVLPNPGAGEVRFTIWTAQSGGAITWDHTFSLNSNGLASVPGGINLDAGTSWWQAEFLGIPGFDGSTTSTRTGVEVAGIATTIDNVSITWGSPQIQFTGKGSVSGGAIELVVDDAVHASCWQWGTGMVSCSGANNLPPGAHSAFVRFRPRGARYGSSSSPRQSFQNGPVLPPATGILIEGDRFATNTRDVDIDVATTSDGVRLSNTSSVNGAGLLVDGTTFQYAPRMPWTLSDGADGARTVYMQTIGSGGAPSGAINSDGIYLDTTAPTGSFVINNGDPTVGDPWANTVYDQHLTGTASDNSWPTPGGEITHMAVSNDALSWWVIAYEVHSHTPLPPPGPGPSPTPSPTPTGPSPIAFSFDVLWQVAVDWWGGTSGAGDKTVYIKWRDEAGNWSTPVTDQITQISLNEVGELLVDGVKSVTPNPRHISNPTPQLTVRVNYVPDEGIDRVVVRMEEGQPAQVFDWTGGPGDLSFTWSLIDSHYGYTTGDGVKNVAVEVDTNTGRHAYFGATVILDRSVATSGIPVPAFALGTQVNEESAGDGFGVGPESVITRMLTDIQWKSSITSVKRYDLQRLLNAGWNAINLPSPTATKARQDMSAGTTTQYRVQVTKTSGATQPWKLGPSFGATVVPETALTYSGTWTSEPRNDALGGTIRTTRVAGASIRFTFTGRAISWVAPQVDLGASATVFVDGVKIKTVALSSDDGQYHARQVVFSMSWKVAGKHTIKIVKKYASWAMSIDALMVLN